MKKKLFVLLSLLPSSMALAQESDESREGGSHRQLEEVVVTAERQEASISDTSISITAFTGDQIQELGLRDQADLQNLVPATVILPYDAAVRGVGRNFRSLGGDPGISTYINYVYSEDLYTATIQSTWDIERIEILRGPQGTLYGRNAIGGAMNFIHARPSQEPEAKIQSILGNFNMLDFNGVLSGPLVEDKMAARITWMNRSRDGYIEDLGPGPDLDSRGEENYTLSVNWTPSDNIEINHRVNKISVYRVMGGADGGGLIVFRGENHDGSRNYDRLVNGYRKINREQTDWLAPDWYDPSMEVFTFTNPKSGEVVEGQYRRAGIDVSTFSANGQSNAFNRLNNAYGETLDPNRCVFHDKNNIKGDDLCAITNGHNNEDFEQIGNQFEMTWDVQDSLTLKYIFGTSRYLYQRTTDDDSSRSQLRDLNFYVNHEMSHDSHELQAFYDINEQLSFTSGLFGYEAQIDQRGDFYDTNQKGISLYSDSNTAATDPLHAGMVTHPVFTSVHIFPNTSVSLYDGRATRPDNPEEGTTYSALGQWPGDDGNSWSQGITHGPNTAETYLEYATQSKRKAWAAYTQGVWDISDQFTLTLGLRYATDDFQGEENLLIPIILSASQGGAALGNGYIENRYSSKARCMARDDGSDCSMESEDDAWANFNEERGAIILDRPNKTFSYPDPEDGPQPWVDGMAAYVSAHRVMDRVDKKTTFRVNLDWTPNDRDLVYFSATSGYRSGGFNLVFFSSTFEYNPEELIAYEIGYKSQFLNDTLQVFASTYLYDYSNIHTFGSEVSALGGTTTSVLEAPGARIFGLESEILWLATDNLSFGGNISYTPSEYTETLLIQDAADFRFPDGLIPNQDTNLDIKGNRVLQVPLYKWNFFATWDQPLGDKGDLSITFSGSGISEVFYSQFETDFDRAPGYERYDLRATWNSPDKTWIVTGFVHNLLNEIGIRQIEPHGADDGFRRTGQVTEPRFYGMEITFNLMN